MPHLATCKTVGFAPWTRSVFHQCSAPSQTVATGEKNKLFFEKSLKKNLFKMCFRTQITQKIT